MRAKVQYWNNETLEWVHAERSYEEFTVKNVEVEYGEYYRDIGKVELVLYEDTKTGLIVKDVQAFEKWIKKVEASGIT